VGLSSREFAAGRVGRSERERERERERGEAEEGGRSGWLGEANWMEGIKNKGLFADRWVSHVRKGIK
jgi:hypothetical protein